MPWNTKTLTFASHINAFATANIMIGSGWEVRRLEVLVTGIWPFRRYVYQITFRTRVPPPTPGAIILAVRKYGDTTMPQFTGELFLFLPAWEGADGPEYDTKFRIVDTKINGNPLDTLTVAVTEPTVPVDDPDFPEMAGKFKVGPITVAEDDEIEGEVRNKDNAGKTSAVPMTFAGSVDFEDPVTPGKVVLIVRKTEPVPEPVT